MEKELKCLKKKDKEQVDKLRSSKQTEGKDYAIERRN